MRATVTMRRPYHAARCAVEGSAAAVYWGAMPSAREHRVVILGSGPAGLTAALYASRANLAPLVVEGGGGGDPTDVPGGQLMITTDVDNYPGLPRGHPGPRADGPLPQAGRALRHRVRGRRVEGRRPLAPAVRADPGRTRRSTPRRSSSPPAPRARWLGLPEELEFRTKIGGVSACATCDGFFYKGKDVLVVGGGDTAMEEATFLTKFATKVTVVHRRDELRASKIMQDRAFANPKIALALGQRGREDPGRARRPRSPARASATSRRARSATCPPAASSWPSATSRTPRSSAGQLDMDATGYLVTDGRTTATSVPGVFAAGDVQDPRYRQAVTAAGTGCMAAIDAERFLGEHDRARPAIAGSAQEPARA